MKIAFWIGVVLTAVCSVVLLMMAPRVPGDYEAPAWTIKAISVAILLRRVGFLCLAIAAVLWLFSHVPRS